MLVELGIRNFAIIDELKISFGPGLNVISGETGAGKSILIGAIGLLLGGRASSEQIRSAEDSAVIDALFDLSGEEKLKERISSLGYGDGDELVLRRIITRAGKGRVYINGDLANLGVLSAVSGALVNICSQHEHQVLLDPESHLDILDESGGLRGLRSQYSEEYLRYMELTHRAADLSAASRQGAQKEEFLRFQLRELDEAGIRAGEDSELLDEKNILRNAGKLREHAERAFGMLYGRERSVLQEIGSAVRDIREIKKIDPGFAASDQEIDSIVFGIEDLSRLLRDYAGRIAVNPARLDEIENRLELLSRLKRKHGGTLEGVLKKREEILNELDTLSSADEEIGRIRAEMGGMEADLRRKAEALSSARREKAAILKKAVQGELRSLRMEQAAFDIVFSGAHTGEGMPELNARGCDTVEFYFSANAGEQMKALRRIASGGELSRIVLALKKVLAGADSAGTLIFDEVDSGIGGAVAEVVGEKLRDVAKGRQVLCITHLPQIASFAERHYLVTKETTSGRTVSRVRTLDGRERLEEIARMLGGVDITGETRAHAKEVLKKARRDGR